MPIILHPLLTFDFSLRGRGGGVYAISQKPQVYYVITDC